MRVNVTEKNKTSVALRSLDPGDGFLFDGYPCIVGKSMIGEWQGCVTVFNLRNNEVTAIPGNQLVQLTQIEVEYTV